jgi:hypothetical protein
VGRIHPLSRSKDHLGSAPTGEGDPIEVIQSAGDVAVGQAQAVLHQRHHRLGVRSELDGGGTRGVGGLKRGTSLVSLAAAQTAPDFDIEAPKDGLSRNLFLELTDRLYRLQFPSAIRAGRRQRDRNNLINLLGCSSVGMETIARPSFTARRLGVGLGSSLGKRSGLPFLGPERLLELSDEVRQLAFEIGDLIFRSAISRSRGSDVSPLSATLISVSLRRFNTDAGEKTRVTSSERTAGQMEVTRVRELAAGSEMFANYVVFRTRRGIQIPSI